MTGLSEFHSTCPQDCFHGKHLLWRKNTFQIVFHILGGNFSGFRHRFSSTVVRTALVSRFLIGILPIFFGVHANFYRLVCRNCTLRVHKIVSMGSIFFEKKHFSNFILHFGWRHFRFSATYFQHVSQNCIGFYVFNRTYAFFLTSRKVLQADLSEMHSMCPQDRFHGKHLLWKKNTFQIILRGLHGDYPGFRPKFSSTVVRTALDSSFLIGFMPISFELHAKFYCLGCQNCTLRVHRIVFVVIGSIFFEKKTVFNFYFAFWTETFQVFGDNFPAR